MTLSQQVVKKIITRLLRGEDYRIEIIALINAEFLQFAIEFFKQVVEAKLKNNNITADWYKQAFLHPNLPPKEIAINSGLNKKTIHNMFNSSTKEIVIDASYEHYELLYSAIKDIAQNEQDLELTLTIKFKGVSVDLNVSESLIVVNTLAVKRAELRGGLWSTAGKRVEKPLMLALCWLYRVPPENYSVTINNQEVKEEDFQREVDFYLKSKDQLYKCEVKLMGRGNPESADAVIARDSAIFIADTLSENNKKQLDSLNIQWVALRTANGVKKFAAVLKTLHIPHKAPRAPIEKKISTILTKLFS